MSETVTLDARRVLVTGGSGFIGTQVVQALVRAGATVLSLDLRRARSPLGPRATSAVCDIRTEQFGEITADFSPSVVVHLAAQVDVATAECSPVVDADVNVIGTVAVAEVAATVGAALVFTSTCAVFGEPRRLPAAEDHPVAPSTPYGLSKAAAMQYVEWFARRRGLAATSLLLGNVYGPRTARGVVARFITDATAGRPSTLHANGLTTRDFVHVDDVARAVVAACSVPAAGRVNIGSGTETSIRRLHGLVGAAFGSSIAPGLSPETDGGCSRMRLQVDRAARVLGWTARIRLEDGVVAVARSTDATAHAPLPDLPRRFGGRRLGEGMWVP